MRDTPLQKLFPFQLFGSGAPGACLPLYPFIDKPFFGKSHGCAGLESLSGLLTPGDEFCADCAPWKR